MDDLDFNSYLEKYGNQDDPESDKNSEVEAELYSQLHYNNVQEKMPSRNITDNVSLDLFHQLNEEIANSKYEQVSKKSHDKDTISNSSGEESEDDSGIQIIHKVPSCSDSEPEFQPCFEKKKQHSAKIHVEQESSEGQRGQEMRWKFDQSHQNSSDEDDSCQEIDSSEAESEMPNLTLNLQGLYQHERTFDQVVNGGLIIDDEPEKNGKLIYKIFD